MIDKLLFKSRLEQGAMVNAPVYETHSRGKNWLAIIEKDPKSPGGLSRRFCEKAKGHYYYFITNLKKNDPVEFGADYYTGSGKPSRSRYYGVVISITDDEIIIERSETSCQAISRSQELRTIAIQQPQTPIQDKIELVVEAQEKIFEAIDLLKKARLTESQKTYIIDHLEIIASRDHGFISCNLNLDDVLESLRETE